MNEYWISHPEASVKDVCIAYLHSKGLCSKEPELIDEALAERLAIQSEAT